MKKIYVAGPMRGYPRYNFDAFYEAEKFLSSVGWDPMNPAKTDESKGFKPDSDVVTQEMMMVFIRRDVDMIIDYADAICVLPGWEKSLGATAEVALARWKNIPIYAYPTMEQV